MQQIDELFDNKLKELGNEFIILLPHIFETDFTLEEFDDVNNERIKAMKKVFEEMKETSSKCYEMLMRFWYKNQTMDYIATNMQFAHSDSAKSQKAKCQKQFKTEVYKRVMLWAK